MFLSSSQREKLLITPWTEAYCPVRNDARDGLHSEVVTNAFSKSTPSAAIRSILGVFRKG